MIAGVVVCAAAAAAIAAAQVPTNPAAGRTAADRILGKARLPTGASAAASDPSGGLLAGTPHPATPDLIDLRRFWRVPGDPAAVFVVRSPGERIPADASSIAVSERGLNGHRSGSTGYRRRNPA